MSPDPQVRPLRLPPAGNSREVSFAFKVPAGLEAVISLNEGAVTRLTEYLRDRISEIANEPERFTTLDSPGTVELLRNLAQKGGALHDHLCRHTSLLVLSDARRVHLTSARAAL